MNKEEKTNEPNLLPKAVFGIRSDIPRNVLYFSSEKCAYISGNYIVISTIKEKNQFFIPAVADFGEITCFGLDESKDYLMLAIGQKTTENRAALSITRYQMKTNTNIMTSNYNSDTAKTTKFANISVEVNEFVICISCNASKGVILALMGPRTPSRVLVFSLETRGGNAKMLLNFEMGTHALYKTIDLSTFDPSYFALSGEGGFAVIHIKDYDKKALTTKLEVDPRSSQFSEFASFIFSFVDIAWISATRLAVINSTCDVFIIDFSKKIDTPNKKVIKSSSIFDSEARAKGIFVKNKNIFICKEDGLFQKLEDKQLNDKVIQYEKSFNYKAVPNLPRLEIHTLTTYPNSHIIFLSTQNSQLYYLDLSNENALLDGNNYKYFFCQFHSDEITCIDVCKLKQLVVTCSKDRTIKIWNYINLQNEISSDVLDEDPIGVAFHPNGLHIAALFKKKFRLFHLLEKSMIVYKEVTTYQPSDIKFSNFGNLIAVCYKNNFQIFNFYTLECIATSKQLSEGCYGHSDDIKRFIWDQDDCGFATCGMDGRAYYWQLFSKETQLIDFHHKEYHFIGVDIHTDEDYSKKLILIDENHILEVNQLPKDREEQNLSTITKSKEFMIPKLLRFTDLVYDQESKLILLSTGKEHSPSVHLVQNPFDIKKYTSFQANSIGVKMIKTSYDMSHVFTCGKDSSLFFFNIQHINKTDRRDDSLESGDLILVRKNDLDKEALDLRNRLSTVDSEIRKERERFEEEAKILENEIYEEKTSIGKEIDKYLFSKTQIEEKIKSQIDYYEKELFLMFQEHSIKIEEIRTEASKTKIAKEKDKQKELENKSNEMNRCETQRSQLVKACEEEIEKLKTNYVKLVVNLNSEIRDLEERNEEISRYVEREKSDKMDINDTQISVKRLELENLKKTYEKVKHDHYKLEEKLKSEIKEIKDAIRSSETKKNGDRNELISFQSENAKLMKQITDMQNDKKEKEDTIQEKNNIKRELEKENQELEKFKFVLNYKIKELKHDKDPEERKLQMLEKQAKDMEVEIKKFEFEQARNIIELSKNHDTMKVKEKQIEATEKSIDKIKNYKKLFQEQLYHSMKKAKNHKDLKKELVLLKRLFLDKEFVDVVEKPYESNYESQRQFLEDNITNYGKKISDTQSLFTQDYQKIMRENKKLLTIVNELEKEIKEIKVTANDFKMNKTAVSLRPRYNAKPSLPMFNKTEDSSNDQKAIKLKKQLFELEKEIQNVREKRKKDKLKEDKEMLKMKKLYK